MIVLVGLAGSGKSLQGKLLADKLGCRWLSTGELLRAYLSRQNRHEMLSGKLLTDEQVISILESIFKDMGRDEECVLDGFPRTLRQAKWLLGEHQKGEIKLSALIHLKTDGQTAKSRLLARGREDDTHDAIKQRFAEYELVILPLINMFKKAKVPVYNINGVNTIEKVEADINKALNLK